MCRDDFFWIGHMEEKDIEESLVICEILKKKIVALLAERDNLFIQLKSAFKTSRRDIFDNSIVSINTGPMKLALDEIEKVDDKINKLVTRFNRRAEEAGKPRLKIYHR
ncbi:TPA: hypothetical protein MH346_08985 [Klebsiella pneumoniae]|nr:hypothetical protein [Klebsiella pneumoniae]HBX4902784.1 hypothetical protein [Klebsiella pneumoniae]HBX4904844.1 hypothetical protein [Klebsiella pneumoniae]